MNQRTKHSKHATPTLFNIDEKAINRKFGRDGETHFLNVLNRKYGDKYFWRAFKNNWESVDFYGIPKQEQLYGVEETHYELETGFKADIVIELKSKRIICDPITHKTRSGISGKSKNCDNNIHFCNWTKFIDIKQRLKEGRINKAFIVFDYLREEVENGLTIYDNKNSGDYYFHEITSHSIRKSKDLRKKYRWDNWEDGVIYTKGEKQSRYRDAKDEVINIPAFEMLPMSYFKYRLLPTYTDVKLTTRNTKKNEDLLKNHRDNLITHHHYAKKLNDLEWKFKSIYPKNKMTFDEYAKIELGDKYQD